MKRVLVLDFGGTSVKYGLVDENAELSLNGELSAPLNSTKELVRCIEKLHAEHKDRCDGVAIAMSGVVDSESGYVYSAGAYDPILRGHNLFHLLDGIDKPVSLENDGKSAAVAELWKGSLKGIRNGAVIVIGTGLGGGIIIDGKLQKGPTLSAGEISLLMTENGNYDLRSFAGYTASTSGLLKEIAEAKGMRAAQFGVSSWLTNEGPDPRLPIYSGKDVFRWIEEGDMVTTEVYGKWLKRLAAVIYNLKIILDAERISIGGGVSRNPRLLADLKKEMRPLQDILHSVGFSEIDLCTCSYQADANLIGAAGHWFGRYTNE